MDTHKLVASGYTPTVALTRQQQEKGIMKPISCREVKPSFTVSKRRFGYILAGESFFSVIISETVHQIIGQSGDEFGDIH